MNANGATDLLPPHVAADFYLWLWYRSAMGSGRFDVEDGTPVEVFLDTRLALRDVGDDRPTTLLTGDNPGAAPEARAAILGGKVPKDMRLLVRREDREYTVTLRGTRVSIAGAKLPTQVKTGEPAEVLYDRMFLYEELQWLIGSLLRQFTEARVSTQWSTEIVPAMRAWLEGT